MKASQAGASQMRIGPMSGSANAPPGAESEDAMSP